MKKSPHKNSKEIHYDQQAAVTKYLELKDMAVALQYGSLPAERRVQVKMPSAVVDALDKAYPNIPRSTLLTQLALEALQHKYRYANDPELALLAAEEQSDLDDMWDYLEYRDAQK